MKKIIIITLIFFPLLTYSQANKIYRKALKETDLNQRIELFSEVIKLEPKNFDAYFYRGITKNDLGDYNGAIIDYSKIIVFEPDADTYYNRGNSKYSLEDFEGAKEDYINPIRLDPNFIDAIYSLGCTKFDLGDYQSAIKDFTDVINVTPQYKVFNLRASAYRALKEYKKALTDYTYNVIMTGSSDAYYSRGEFYLSVNYYQLADNDFTMGIKLNKNNSFAYFYRGTTRLLLGRYTDAISDFYKALEFDATDFDAMLGLSLAFYGIEDINNANLYLQKSENILSKNQATKKDLELFKNTYWFQNQNYLFTKYYEELIKL